MQHQLHQQRLLQQAQQQQQTRQALMAQQAFQQNMGVPVNGMPMAMQLGQMTPQQMAAYRQASMRPVRPISYRPSRVANLADIHSSMPGITHRFR
jgi:hypothetical protein